MAAAESGGGGGRPPAAPGLYDALDHDSLEELCARCDRNTLLALQGTCSGLRHLLTHGEKAWAACLRRDLGLQLKARGGCLLLLLPWRVGVTEHALHWAGQRRAVGGSRRARPASPTRPLPPAPVQAQPGADVRWLDVARAAYEAPPSTLLRFQGALTLGGVDEDLSAYWQVLRGVCGGVKGLPSGGATRC